MKGKNKLVPRLLGVTKESILRVDEKTKEVSAQLGKDNNKSKSIEGAAHFWISHFWVAFSH